MRSVILIAVSVALCATNAFAQNKTRAASETTALPQLEVGIRTYGADGRVRGHAIDSTTGKAESYVWADKSMCGIGSSSTMPTTTPWVGWHVVGIVQNASQGEGLNSITYRIDWQRIWQNGARVADGMKGQSTSSLKEGARLELDRVVGTAAEGCGVTEVRLEVGVAGTSASQRTLNYYWQRGGTLAGQGAGTGAGAGTGLSGWMSGTGADANWVLLPKMKTTDAWYKDFVEVAKSNAIKKGFPGLTPIGSYDAELWLVHRRPDGTETTQQQSVRFSQADQTFTFPAVVVPTSKGDISLDISGSVRASTPADAFERSSYFQFGGDTSVLRWARAYGGITSKDAPLGVALTMTRRGRAAGTPALDTRGGSYFYVDMPPATEVLSFEFPVLPAAETLLKGHTFSLRIRVKPVEK